jgi:hypothetical protein
MATAELLHSPSQITSSNGVIPHDTPNPQTTINTTNTTTNGPIDQPPFDSSVFQSYSLALLPPVLIAAPSELESIFQDEVEGE